MTAEAGTSCKLQEDPRTSSEQRAKSKSDRKHIRVPINLQEREGDQTWIGYLAEAPAQLSIPGSV